ncbi:response regulator [Bacteriovorax sp. Seq25_V]|uniref:response regulator n=1 Tax=Bacteriovorax sp. Seq25_V TaxID=1201288 RepID=UPI00038A186A|nr:response regulator [Bacteriovorax sp. Seq25_V]EQC48025.1 response regulator receiver domain protein [Bacteriovorax sp. Seq25_V]
MSLNLIIVDDEVDIFILYELFLKKEIAAGQVALKCFSSAGDCIKYLESEEINCAKSLVLSDINMPEMDGYELLSKARELYSDLPIYMVTAYSREDYVEKAMNLGGQGLIPKPVDFNELKNLISSHF